MTEVGKTTRVIRTPIPQPRSVPTSTPVAVPAEPEKVPV